jgi:hypothetical protein
MQGQLSLKQYQKEATTQHNGRTAGVQCMLPNLQESKGMWRRQAKEALFETKNEIEAAERLRLLARQTYLETCRTWNCLHSRTKDDSLKACSGGHIP